MNISKVRKVATGLIFHMLLMNFALFVIPPVPVVAQAPTQVITRFTLPLGSNTHLVVENKNGVESQTAIISDKLASTKVILSSDGATNVTPQYYPYGNNLAIQQFNNPNNRYYTGQRKIDSDDSLYNYNARFYSPETGVFTQPDTVQGLNRFAYVGGNPIMRNDPSGHMSTGSEAYGGRKSSGEYIDILSNSLQSVKGGSSFKNTRDMYNMPPDQGIPDSIYKPVVGGAIAGAAVFGGYEIGLLATTACMGNMPACQDLIGGLAGDATGGAPVTFSTRSLVPGLKIVAGINGQADDLIRHVPGIEYSAIKFGDALDTTFAGSGSAVNTAVINGKELAVKIDRGFIKNGQVESRIADYLDREVGNAAILNHIGVGPDVHYVVKGANGDTIGYAMDIVQGNFPELAPGNVNTTSILGLHDTVARILSAGYDIGDFQYFVRPGGEVSVIDAGAMREIGFFGDIPMLLHHLENDGPYLKRIMNGTN